MVAIDSPSSVSQACSAWPVSASGRPEAKPSTMTTNRRHRAVARAAVEVDAAPVEEIGIGGF